MQKKEKTERFFSLELKSKHQIKNMTMSKDGQNENVLIEGNIGNLVEATINEGVILEVTGSIGTIRLDLQPKEITDPSSNNNPAQQK